MNIDVADRFIVKTAAMIDLGVPLEEIRDNLVQIGVSGENARLIYLAAKTLSDSRQDKNI